MPTDMWIYCILSVKSNVIRGIIIKFNSIHIQFTTRGMHGLSWKMDCQNWKKEKNNSIRCNRKTSTSPTMSVIKWRRWTWIGHIIRMPPNAIPKITIRWTPNAGRRKRGRPEETWRKSVERGMKDNGLIWAQVEHLARNRSGWRSLVSALCATGHEED